MAFDFSQIMQAQWERLQAEAAQATADLEAARHAEDVSGTHMAATRILELDAQKAALAQRANSYVASQQAGPMMPGAEDLPRRDLDLCRKYGVSPNELGVAKGWTSDPKLSDEARVAEYSANRARLAHMRATGQYDDSQGRVFKR